MFGISDCWEVLSLFSLVEQENINLYGGEFLLYFPILHFYF